jgi:hypothetical protein
LGYFFSPILSSEYKAVIFFSLPLIVDSKVM